MQYCLGPPHGQLPCPSPHYFIPSVQVCIERKKANDPEDCYRIFWASQILRMDSGAPQESTDHILSTLGWTGHGCGSPMPGCRVCAREDVGEECS